MLIHRRLIYRMNTDRNKRPTRRASRCARNKCLVWPKCMHLRSLGFHNLLLLTHPCPGTIIQQRCYCLGCPRKASICYRHPLWRELLPKCYFLNPDLHPDNVSLSLVRSLHAARRSWVSYPVLPAPQEVPEIRLQQGLHSCPRWYVIHKAAFISLTVDLFGQPNSDSWLSVLILVPSHPSSSLFSRSTTFASQPLFFLLSFKPETNILLRYRATWFRKYK